MLVETLFYFKLIFVLRKQYRERYRTTKLFIPSTLAPVRSSICRDSVETSLAKVAKLPVFHLSPIWTPPLSFAWVASNYEFALGQHVLQQALLQWYNASEMNHIAFKGQLLCTNSGFQFEKFTVFPFLFPSSSQRNRRFSSNFLQWSSLVFHSFPLIWMEDLFFLHYSICSLSLSLCSLSA